MKIPTMRDIAFFIYPSIFAEQKALSVRNIQLKIDKSKITQENNKLINEYKVLENSSFLKIGKLSLKLKDAIKAHLSLKLKDAIKAHSVCVLDTYLNKTYNKIGNIAYKGKRFYKDKEIRVYLNQLITPIAYEVQLIKNKFNRSEDDFVWIQKIADWIAANVTWTSDKDTSGLIDYLTYPEEVLVYKKDDCEGHAFLLASFEPNFVGVCYGYMTINNKKFGHAWNCMLYNGNLYYIETTANRGTISDWNNEAYEPHFIVTKNSTFRIKSGVSFGKLAKIIKK